MFRYIVLVLFDYGRDVVIFTYTYKLIVKSRISRSSEYMITQVYTGTGLNFVGSGITR